MERDSPLDLDKAWQPLHFLLTGAAWEGEEPGCCLIRGGEELVDDELGYSARDRGGAADSVGHLLEAFDALQSFVAVTADRREGAIAYLT